MKKETYYKELKDKGFSLVEIVVIIAIMIVLLAVLAPSLLRYTETSRMQKDDSAMDELCGTVQLALADAETFDEACSYAILNNYITYTDSSGVYGAKYTDEEFWAPDGSGEALTITFNPDENGNYTIANGLVNDMTYENGSVADSRTAEGLKQCYFSEMGDGKLYHKVEQTFGATFAEKSATYKNSSYTVFIKLDVVNGIKRANVYGEWNGTNLSPDCPASLGSGTSSYIEEEPEQTKNGGTTQSNFTSSDLQGSGGGTSVTPSYKNYLPCGHLYGAEGDHSELGCKHYACENCACVPASCGVEGHYEGDGMDHTTKVNHISSTYRNPHVYKCQCEGWVVPDGGTYYVRVTSTTNSDYSGATTIYNPGDIIPCGYAPQMNDVYTFKNYEYRYNMEWYWSLWCNRSTQNGWAVQCTKDTKDPGEILPAILDKPITQMAHAFKYCPAIEVAPIIPNTVTSLSEAFQFSYNLKTYAGAPHGTADGDFSNYKIPDSVTNMQCCFDACTSIVKPPILSNNVVRLVQAFGRCTSLEAAPVIPESVEWLNYAFQYCPSIKGVITINCNAENYPGCFSHTDMQYITINGTADTAFKQAIANTGKNSSQVTII